MIKRPDSLVERVSRPDFVPVRSSANKLVFGVSAVIGGSFILSNTLFKEPSRYFDEMTIKGRRVPVSKHALSLAEKAMDDLKYSSEEKKLVQLITGSGKTTSSIGSSDNIFGTYIIVPAFMISENLNYSTQELVKVMQAAGVPEEKIITLRDSFKLSDDAKLYSIARQLVKSRSCISYVADGLFASLISSFTLFGAIFINDRFLTHLDFLRKSPVFVLCSVLGMLVYISAHSLMSHYLDTKAEHCMCSLGEPYVSGGIELCEKASQRFAIFDEYFPSLSAHLQDFSHTADLSFSDRLSLLKQKNAK